MPHTMSALWHLGHTQVDASVDSHLLLLALTTTHFIIIILITVINVDYICNINSPSKAREENCGTRAT